MTNKSDRPDGRRFHACDTCRTHHSCNKTGQCLFTRAAPSPTRDGAEGAGNFKSCGDSDVKGKSTQGADFTAAPPKPALDAVREALKDALGEIVLVIAFLERDSGTDRLPATIKSLVARLVKADRAIRDILAAPVPSPGGAAELRELAHQLESADWGDAPAPMRVLALKVCRAIHALSPSPAVAAERVKIQPPSNPIYCNLDAERFCKHATHKCVGCPLYAIVAPAERIEMVDYSKGYLSGEPTDPVWRLEVGGICADFPTETAANNFRNAILSLPVQPTRLDKDRLYAVLSKSLPQSVRDVILQDANEAGVFVQPGAGEREAVRIDKAYAEGVRACLQRLEHLRRPADDKAWKDCEAMWRNRIAEVHTARQAPHSSSETET